MNNEKINSEKMNKDFEKMEKIIDNIVDELDKLETLEDIYSILSFVFKCVNRSSYKLYGEVIIEDIKESINTFHQDIFEDFEEFIKNKDKVV